MSFQLLLEDWQGSSSPDGDGKIIPPARNGERECSGEWFWASLWWYHEASLTSRSQTSDLQTCKIEQSLQCALWRSAGHQRLHQDFWPKLMGYLLMNLTESWSHAVELEWQGGHEAQSLPGWAVDGVLSSMPRCLPGSLRSVQLPLDHLVEMRDRAVCHQHRNGRRNHVPVWWEPVM